MKLRYILIYLAGGISFLLLERGVEVFLKRPGMFGGEILILPLMVLLFLMGKGYERDRQEEK